MEASGTHEIVKALFRTSAAEGQLGVLHWCLSSDAGGLGIIDSKGHAREPWWGRTALIEGASRGHQLIVRCEGWILRLA
jgi:hypothetical protein